MISLDLMESSEVRIAGDQPKYYISSYLLKKLCIPSKIQKASHRQNIALDFHFSRKLDGTMQICFVLPIILLH